MEESSNRRGGGLIVIVLVLNAGVWLAWRTRSVLYGALLHAYIINLVIFAARG